MRHRFRAMLASLRAPSHGAHRSLAYWFAVAALLGGAGRAAAQGRGTVSGSVTDAANGHPLSGASIVVVGTGQGALTRPDGSYRLTLPEGRYQVLARHIGYAVVRDSVVVTAGQTATRDFRLTETAVALDAVVAVGSRAQERTVTESPVPVDVLTHAELLETGKTETAQIIQTLAPSFNFPRPSVTDGTDHVRPATLRGLGPDQVLVLINGKRRHTSALVNINGSVGRGSTGVDFNAIPSSAIDRIEILRDGAAAQYGSDAIAGVINIILKSDANPELQTELGETKERDGQVAQVALNAGRIFGSDGFVHFTGEFRHRDSTNRSLPDNRVQCTNSGFTFPGCTEADVHGTRTHWLGDPITRDLGFFLNAALPTTTSGVTVYGFGGGSVRDGEAAGFFRRGQDDRTLRAFYPEGFLPLISSQVVDGSGTLGVKGAALGWQWDLSSVYGHDSFDFDVKHSVNTSMGTASPRDFYAGTLVFNQLTNNFDVSRSLGVGLSQPIDVAAGAEFRTDWYQIHAGDSASWKNGGVPILDGPHQGNPAAVGAQVFPGFRPSDEVNATRSNVAGYLDLEGTVLPKLLLGAAGRVEHYTDFGTATTGKLSGRYEVVPALALRGSVQTGFRAPSLAQEFLSATSTNFQNVNGQSVPFDIKTFPATSEGGKALGAKPLRPERSRNYGVGFTLQPGRSLSVTVDGYQLDIKRRIVFTGNFTGTAIQTRLAAIGYPSVNGARFFTNAVATRTRGLDVVALYGLVLPNAATLRFTGGFNRNYTKLTNDPNALTPPELGNQGQVLFDRVERGRLTRGQPNSTVQAGASYGQGPFGFSTHVTRYGEVTSWNINPATNPDQTFKSKTLTDLELSYKFFGTTRVAVGANNIFNVYPDVNLAPNSNSGIFPYPSISPFGFNGAYYYVRLNVGTGL